MRRMVGAVQRPLRYWVKSPPLSLASSTRRMTREAGKRSRVRLSTLGKCCGGAVLAEHRIA